jgi:hypothetical protein
MSQNIEGTRHIPIFPSGSVPRFGLSGDLTFTVILGLQAKESLDQTHLGKRFFALLHAGLE